MADPQITYTHAALVFAATRGGTAALETAAQAALAELQKDGLDDVADLFFHCFDFGGELTMIMSPKGGTLVIDCRGDDELSQGSVDGLFDGKQIVTPTPFSGDL